MKLEQNEQTSNEVETHFNFSLEDAENYLQGLKDWIDNPNDKYDDIEGVVELYHIGDFIGVQEEINKWELYIRLIKITINSKTK